MNVLGISGTPRKNGNSEILLQYALRPFGRVGTGLVELAKSRHGGVPVRTADSHKGCPYGLETRLTASPSLLFPPTDVPVWASREGKITSLSLDRFDKLTTSGRGLG